MLGNCRIKIDSKNKGEVFNMIKENKRDNINSISSNDNITSNTCNSKYKYSI